MKLKKMLSLLTSATLFTGLICASPVLQDGTLLFASPIVAEASGTVYSGQTNGIQWNLSSAVTLYLTANTSTREMAIKGSKITGDHVEVTVPDTFTYNNQVYTITGILDNAFSNQTNLGAFKGDPRHIAWIGNSAFAYCTNLTDISFPRRGGKGPVNHIGAGAFSNCTSLAYADCFEAAYIGDGAFSQCSSLQMAWLSNTEYLGSNAFSGCTGLTAIDLTQTALTSISGLAFYNCWSAKTIRLPETITQINWLAFYNCCALQKIYIPDSVTHIEYGAFAQCSALRTVLMSENIVSIGNSAFYGCNQMRFFVCKNPNASIGYQAVGYANYNGSGTQKISGFVIWGRGGGIQDYASSNGFTYKDVNSIDMNTYTSNFRQYEWSLPNASVNWAKSNKYYFNAQHRPYANTHYGATFAGICSGMAAVSALTANGFISVQSYAPGYSTIRQINQRGYIPDFTKSYVTTVWANLTLMGEYSTEYQNNGPVKFGTEMLRYAEYITYGADKAVFSVHQAGEPGHSMVCFGMEFKQNASDRSSNSYWNGKDARILIYNVNRSSDYKSEYIYVNLTNGSWSWPNTGGYDASRCSFNMGTPESMLACPSGCSPARFLDILSCHG